MTVMYPLALPSRNFSEHEERNFRPTPANTSLDDIVPSDNFYYRRIEERLELSLVRDW